MISAPKPQNETERLSALYKHNILDTMPEVDFDDITRLATEICQTNISLVSLIDADRQWFKSKQGLAVDETPRDLAFCAHAILNPEDLFIVPDANVDERFADNPLVTGEPRVIFYAGVPLVSEGHAIGTLCVIDDKPKQLSDNQRKALRALGNQVTNILKLRVKTEELAKNQQELREVNAELQKFAEVTARDIQSPCNSIIGLSDIITNNYADKLDVDGRQIISTIKYFSQSLKRHVDDILKHASAIYSLNESKSIFTLVDVINDIKPQLGNLDNINIQHLNGRENIYSYKNLLCDVLVILVENGIKFNKKISKTIRIVFTENKTHYNFAITDNGIGIPIIELKKIFDMFYVVGSGDNTSGNGVGLHTAKRIVDKLGGKIEVVSEEGEGTTVSFSVRK